MAIREVAVEVSATYIVKVNAGSSTEAIKKAEDLVLFGIVPDYMDSIILDVQPIKEKNKS